jgi:hypothetical protein
MRELVKLVAHPDPDSRLFPTVLPGAEIYQPGRRLEYGKYWQDERDRLNLSLRELKNQEGLDTARSEIDLYAEVARAIDPLTGWLLQLLGFPRRGVVTRSHGRRMVA